MKEAIEYKKLSLDDNLSGIWELIKVFPKKGKITPERIINGLKDMPVDSYGIWLAKNEIQKDIGFPIWYKEDLETAYFWFIAVDKEHSKKGVGAKLLDLAIEETYKKGFSRMLLDTHESSKEMVRLCEKRNFKEIRREPFPWKTEDDFSIEYVLDLKNYFGNI